MILGFSFSQPPNVCRLRYNGPFLVVVARSISLGAKDCVLKNKDGTKVRIRTRLGRSRCIFIVTQVYLGGKRGTNLSIKQVNSSREACITVSLQIGSPVFYRHTCFLTGTKQNMQRSKADQAKRSCLY